MNRWRKKGKLEETKGEARSFPISPAGVKSNKKISWPGAKDGGGLRRRMGRILQIERNAESCCILTQFFLNPKLKKEVAQWMPQDVESLPLT